MTKKTGDGGTLSGGQVFSYSLGDVANNLTFMMTSMFLMVYMTDIAGVSTGVAGTIYGVTKIWAGVADLLAGQVVDRTNTRWGAAAAVAAVRQHASRDRVRAAVQRSRGAEPGPEAEA
ncbi:hypothetical protein GCM10028820_27880 [Tessaracoccus terricola]